jgi:hypothetical protein
MWGKKGAVEGKVKASTPKERTSNEEKNIGFGRLS